MKKNKSSNFVTIFKYVIGTVYIYSWKKIDKILTHFGGATYQKKIFFGRTWCSTWQWSDLPVCKPKPKGNTQFRFHDHDHGPWLMCEVAFEGMFTQKPLGHGSLKSLNYHPKVVPLMLYWNLRQPTSWRWARRKFWQTMKHYLWYAVWKFM